MGARSRMRRFAPALCSPIYHKHANARMSDLITRLELPDGGHDQPVVRQGDPASQVLEHAAATQAGMLVVGTKGQGFIARMLVGSVATKSFAGRRLRCSHCRHDGAAQSARCGDVIV